MDKFLSNPAWSGISGLLTLIGVIYSIFQAKTAAKKKEGNNDTTPSAPTPIYYGYYHGVPSPQQSRSFAPSPGLVMAITAVCLLFFIISLSSLAGKSYIIRFNDKEYTVRFGPHTTPTVAPSTPVSSITVINQLVLPVRIHIGADYTQIISASSQIEIPVSGAVDMSYEVVRYTNNAGNSLGDDMSGSASQVVAGDTIAISNLIGAQYYFYPVVTNLFAEDCTVVVNEGLPSESRPDALIEGGRVDVGIGYYQLHNNSNVTLHCGDHYSWHGTLGNQADNYSLVPYVEKDTGLIQLKFYGK